MNPVRGIRKMIITYVLAGFLLLSSVAVLVLVSRGLHNSFERSAEIVSQMGALEEERRRARTAENIFDEHGSEISRIERFFLKQAAPVDFIEELEGLASSTGTTLLISPAEGSTVKGFLSLRLEVVGSKEGALRFLKLLELSAHDVRVEEINWKSDLARSSLVLRINTKTL